MFRIYDYTEEFLKQNNRLCFTTLMVGMAVNKQVIEENHFRKVIADHDLGLSLPMITGCE
jgi:hypothetical protein